MKPRTSHTNMFSAPDVIIPGQASAPEMKWCGVCRCWDLGLIESRDGSMYTHPDHEED